MTDCSEIRQSVLPTTPLCQELALSRSQQERPFNVRWARPARCASTPRAIASRGTTAAAGRAWLETKARQDLQARPAKTPRFLAPPVRKGFKAISDRRELLARPQPCPDPQALKAFKVSRAFRVLPDPLGHKAPLDLLVPRAQLELLDHRDPQVPRVHKVWSAQLDLREFRATTDHRTTRYPGYPGGSG